MTTEIVNRHTDRLVIESPNANAWARHPKLAKSTHDAAPGDITSKLRYKCEAAGKELIEADRHYASTRTCSNLKCGWFWSDMGLSDRMFICQQCGLVLDRDINAARNLKQWNKNTEHSPSLGGDPRDGKNFDESSNPASDKPRPQSKVLVSAKASQDSAISLA